MGRGRGSAIIMRPCLALGVAIICILALTEPAFGATYSVGGSGGWTYNVNKWPIGNTFKAGDVFDRVESNPSSIKHGALAVFKYSTSWHNVVSVKGKAYTRCKKRKGDIVYQTGEDSIKLRKGHNYFICSTPGHCQAGMKIDVYAH